MFIRIDDVVLNTELIECVLPNKVVIKRGEDLYDKDETEVRGITIWTVGGENSSQFTFENLSLEDFMEMVKWKLRLKVLTELKVKQPLIF